MSLSPFSLQNKAALVIGASTPIGRATAVALAEAGARVALTTIQPGEQEEAAVHTCVRDLQALAGSGFAEVIDTTSEEDVTTAVRRTVATFGGLDILVNASDLPFAKPLSDVTLREWHRVLEINLTGVYLACRAASGPMLAQGKGRIINVISLLGE